MFNKFKEMLLSKDFIKKALFFLVSNFFYALAIQLFYVQNNIAAGGFAGIATVISYIFPVSIGVVVFILNFPLLIWAYFVFGFKYAASTFASSLVYSVMVDQLQWIENGTDNIVLAALAGGVLYAVGATCMYQAETSAGGSDLLAKLLRYYMPSLSLGTLYLIVDGFCVMFAIFVFQDIELGIVAMLAVYVCSYSTDRFLSSGEGGCLCYIITSKDPLNMSREIGSSLYRGVTCQKGIGMYHQKENYILLIVVRTREVTKLKKIAAEHDKNAFVVVAQANEMKGGGFQNKNGHYNSI